MPNPKLLHAALNHGFELSVIRISDKQRFQINAILDNGRVSITDEEGYRKDVKACDEECTCGNDYVFHKEDITRIEQWQQLKNFSVDFKLISKYQHDFGQAPQFGIGDWVALRSPDLEVTGQPDASMLVYVSHLYHDKHRGTWIFSGYSTARGEIVPVSGECWRFSVFDLNQLP